MKILSLTLLVLCVAPSFAFLQGEFLTGFESGIFMRNNPKMLDEYKCAAPTQGNTQFDKLNDMIKPMKAMSELVPDANIKQLVSTVEVFVANISTLLAVFNNYKGSEFCRGALFGMKGAEMLTKIASTALNLMMTKTQSRGPRKAQLPF